MFHSTSLIKVVLVEAFVFSDCELIMLNFAVKKGNVTAAIKAPKAAKNNAAHLAPHVEKQHLNNLKAPLH